MTLPHHTTDGPADAPALILAPSLGTSLRLWDAQVPALARDHRVIRYDLPGHGGSPAGLLREHSVPALAALVLELADTLGVDRFAYAGVSLGGAVGAWLAAHHPDRVDRATSGPFTAPFQDLITRYAWGEIWTRPGLDRRTRSCVTLTALVAGGHHEELAMHVRAARTNGLTAAGIQEVLLQCAIYCGVPAANTAFAIADRVLTELEGEDRA